MQNETKSHVEHITSPAGHAVTILRFEGDIDHGSRDVVLGAYHGLPKESSKLILMDFTKVGYINSSGITLVIQLLMEACQSAQKLYAFGLTPHFTKVFTVAGLSRYAGLFHSEAEALAAL